MTTLFSPRAGEAGELEALHRGLDEFLQAHQLPKLVAADGTEFAIPQSIFDVLCEAAAAMARGATVTLIPQGQELTTQAAADLLQVSRPHLIKLLDRGEMPHHRVGAHRRIRIDDVLAYRARRAEERERALTELAQAAQEAGGYD